MRGRRQVLQVSTFPFLAVLLCAMGSLILLLLVIDRRAKAVARAKAMHAIERAEAEEARRTAEAHRLAEKHAASEQAEWERRRQALHNQLLQEDQGLLAQLKSLEDKKQAASGRFGEDKRQSEDLRGKLRAEEDRLAQARSSLSARRAQIEQKRKATAAEQAELARISEELARMERTVSDLKAARLRQQQTYSLVPYRGRRGDTRRPIYVECTGDGLVFHPDRQTIQGVSLTRESIRAEVERRITAQRARLTPASSASPASQTPYLLMLIRPDGIVTYSRTVAALQGVSIDFGYEFIDTDWVLDFPTDDDSPGTQPWMVAGQSSAPNPPRVSGNQPSGPRTKLTGLRASMGGIPSAGQPRGPRLGPPGEEGGELSPGLDGGQQGLVGAAAGTPAGAAGPGGPLPGAPAGAPGGVGGGWTPGLDGGKPGLVGAKAGTLAGATVPGGPLPGAPGGPPGTGGTLPNGTGGPMTPGGSVPGAAGIAASGVPGSSPGQGFAGSSPGSGPGAQVAVLGQPIRAGSDLMPAAGLPSGTPGSPIPGAGLRQTTVPGPSGAGGPGASGGSSGSSAGASGSEPGSHVGSPSESGPGSNAQAGPGHGSGGSAGASLAPGAFRPVGDPVPGAASGAPGTPAFAPGASSGPGSQAAGSAGAGGAVAAEGGQATGGGPKGELAGSAGAVPGSQAGVPSQAGESGSATARSEQGSSSATGSAGRSPGPASALLSGSGPATSSRPERRSPLILGGRDWDIWIECTANALVLYPSRLRFPTESLSGGEGGGDRLVQAVRQMIARKQGTVRPGDPPYQPRIRFLIRPPGGLRSYYQSYPLLQAVGVPMARENLEAEEDVYQHMFGR